MIRLIKTYKGEERMARHRNPGSRRRLATLTLAVLAAGCSSTPSSDEILSRADELTRRAQSMVTPPARDVEMATPAQGGSATVGDSKTFVATPVAPGREADTAAPAAGKAMADAGNRDAASTGDRMAATASPPAAAGSATVGAAPAGDGTTDALLPPNAKPGQCFARIYVEPTYRMVEEPMVMREATSRIDTVPPMFEEVTEQVMVKPGDKRIEVVPARYEWVEERVLVTPESTRLVEVPAVNRQVQERVLVKAGYTTWKKGTGPIQKIDETTGEILCLVEVPPVYDMVTKTVQVSPPSVREEIVPAVYRTVRKQILVSPAQTREIEVPAEFRDVKVKRLVSPAREVRVEIPAQMGRVERREMVTPGKVEWREILCETNTTRRQVQAIQRALRDAGFDPGPIDGIVAKRTMDAVNAYQRANGLPVDTYLNMATVRALGVDGGE